MSSAAGPLHHQTANKSISAKYRRDAGHSRDVNTEGTQTMEKKPGTAGMSIKQRSCRTPQNSMNAKNKIEVSHSRNQQQTGHQ